MWRCCAYQENTKEIFEQIPTEITTPTLEYFKRKRQKLLTNIGSEWYLNTMCNIKLTMEKPSVSKKKQQG